MRHTNTIRIDTLTFSVVADQSSTHAPAKTTEHWSNAAPQFANKLYLLQSQSQWKNC